MRETERRIEAYQKLLPGIKEKITAVAMLLALSVVMLTSASFAWLTISRAPEVSQVTTNIAANGNLEIALATGDGETPPDESQVGDSMAAENQNVAAANITWGNLVNLGDTSYALDKIVLRPAQLLNDNLNIRPLTAAKFDSSGRVTETVSDFGYARWHPNEELTEGGYFEMTEEFGIRAISATTYDNLASDATGMQAEKKINEATNANTNALSIYRGLNEYADALGKIVEIYAQNMVDSYLGGGDETVYIDVNQLEDLINAYNKLIEAYKAEAEAIAKSINTQYFLVNPDNLVEYSADQVLKMTGGTGSNSNFVYDKDTQLKAEYKEGVDLSPHNITIKNFKEFIDDYNNIVSARDDLQEFHDSDKPDNQKATFDGKEDGIYKYVDALIKVNSCQIEGTPVSKLTEDIMGTLTKLGQDEVDVVIVDGILKRFENRLGAGIEMKTEIQIDVPIFSDIDTTAIITTSADQQYFAEDSATATNLKNVGVDNKVYGEAVLVAGDTYGLAVDLWVRTNAFNSYLILEGEPKLSEEGTEVRLTTEDSKGNIVPVFKVEREYTDTVQDQVITVKMEHFIYNTDVDLWFEYDTITGTLTDNEIILQGGESPTKTGQTIEVDGKSREIYRLERNEEGEDKVYHIAQKTKNVWFEVDKNSRFELREDEKPPEEATEIVYDVIGYEGENRVWEQDSLYGNNNLTTQGMGSCFVFYPSSPENQERSLNLLKSLEVAFVGSDGSLLTKAFMDTEHAYEDNGRVTVPIIIDPDADVIGTDDEGNDIRAITRLEKNEATRITAIVYLSGSDLGNEDVFALADENIQGQLNIQFGSSQNLNPIPNEKLESMEVNVSATVDQTTFNFDDQDLTTKVTVTVDSTDEPESVTAFFLRSINGTQGIREEEFTLTKDDEGKWVSDYTFTAPGKYILRTVVVDGHEYVVKEAPEVVVEGFSITGISCSRVENGTGAIMTADSSADVDIVVTFAASDKLPSKVQGRFQKDDGSILTVNFTNNGDGRFTGSAKFTTSGSYNFRYLIIDDNYTEVDEAKQFTINVRLGMRVRVETLLRNTSFVLDEEKMTEDQKFITMRVWIMDDAGREIDTFFNTSLIYKKGVEELPSMLQWTGKYYEGTFKPLEASYGKWEFGYVVAEGYTISKATEAPEFTFISPEPPRLGENTTPEIQYAGFNNAYMSVKIFNSDAATVKAIIVDEDNVEHEVLYLNENSNISSAEEDDAKEWKFVIPLTSNNQEEGTYKLTELHLSDVYNEKGELCDEENPMIFKVSGNETYIYRNFDVTIGGEYAGETTTYKGDAFKSNVVRASEFEIVFENKNSKIGKNMIYTDGSTVKPVITDVKLTFEYQPDTSSEYGPYDSSTVFPNGYKIPAEFKPDQDTVYKNAKDVDFVYAGEYVTVLSYQVAGQGTYTVRSDDGTTFANTLPVFIVESSTPEIKVTKVSPTGTFSVNSHASANTGGGFTELTGVSNSSSDYYATVYIRYTGATLGTWRNYAEPSVTLGISEISISSELESATVEFGNISDGQYAKTFDFKNGLTQTSEIGYAQGSSLTDANPPLFPAGKQTVDFITVVHDGNTFIVDLEHEVTINQPQYPPRATFAINDSTYSGTVPGAVYSTDGETITLTLPNNIEPWRTSTPTTSNGEFVQQGDPTTRNVYTQRDVTSGSGCNATTTTYYTPYIETTTIYTASGTTTTVTTTKTITGWKIDGTTYAPGETVTVSGNKTITAVITSTSETTAVPSVTTRTVIAYTQNGDESTSVPSGTKVDEAENKTENKTEDVVN